MRNTIYGGTTATPTPIVNVDGKEDKSNRIDDLKVPQSDLVGKYPSALAVDDLIRTYNDGMQHELGLKADKSQIGDIETALENKVDKEEGKTLYRGMELIWEHTINENTLGVAWGSIDKDMNGNKFKLDEIYFFIQAPSSFTSQLADKLSVTCNKNSDVGYYFFTETVKSGTRTLQAYGKRVKEKRWFTMRATMASAIYNGVFYGSYPLNDVDYVTAFRVMGLEQFPTGTQVIFCGRRVD